MAKYIIIWWGPAWSALWNFLLKNWVTDVTIIEKETFWRHHIGESMQPDVFNIFSQLWIDIDLLEKAFPKKYGAVYKWGKYKDKWTVLYSKELDDKWNKNEEIENLQWYEYGYNVDRSIFDKILLDNFLLKWWKLITQKVVWINVSKETNNNHIDNLVLQDGSHIVADFYIDATWQDSLFSSFFKLKKFDTYLRNSTIYGYYKGFLGLDKTLGKDFQFIENVWDAWYWWIPISYDIVSVWIVYNTQKKFLDNDFFEFVKQSEIYESIKNAELVDPDGNPTTKLRYISDWSFLSETAYWDNWFLVWDAFWFVDPILSWGASFAMEKAIYLWKILILIDRLPGRKSELCNRYESDYKKDVLDYLKMAYLWYQNWNSKGQWLDETWGTKLGFVDYISWGKRFLYQQKIFQDWQNDKISSQLFE